MKAKGQAPNPWMARVVHDRQMEALMLRCIAAETCMQQLLDLVTQDNGAFLAAHAGDWKAATEELCRSQT